MYCSLMSISIAISQQNSALLCNLTNRKPTQQIPSCFHVCWTEEISFHSKNNSGLILLPIHCELEVILLKYLG